MQRNTDGGLIGGASVASGRQDMPAIVTQVESIQHQAEELMKYAAMLENAAQRLKAEPQDAPASGNSGNAPVSLMSLENRLDNAIMTFTRAMGRIDAVVKRFDRAI